MNRIKVKGLKFFDLLKIRWQKSFEEKYFSLEFLVSIIMLIVILIIFSRFTQYVEMRKGVVLNDPLLALFNPIDFTHVIFSLIYGALIITIVLLITLPLEMMILIQSYAVMVMLRITMMYLLPLNPPIGMIVLKDPIVEAFGSGRILLNDLFFSGHTATMSLLFFSVPKKWKWFYLIGTILVGTFILLQKVHYSVDVLVAPFVCFTIYNLIKNRILHTYINKLQ